VDGTPSTLAYNVAIKGRPWNPPYQPKSGMTGKPVEEWAAGGGLDAILVSDANMAAQLFPDVTADADTLPASSYADVWAAFNKSNGAATSTALRMPNMQLPIQLPDWNRWLPEVHPMDLFGTVNVGGVLKPAFEVDGNPYGQMNLQYKQSITELRKWRKNYGTETQPSLTDAQATNLIKLISEMELRMRDLMGLKDPTKTYTKYDYADLNDNAPPRFLKPVWLGAVKTTLTTTLNTTSDRVARETAKRALAAWLSVKHYEIMTEWALQDQAKIFDVQYARGKAKGGVGEVFGWPLDRQSVFAHAPHITADSIIAWGYDGEYTSATYEEYWKRMLTIEKANLQARNRGLYLSVAWYQLQAVLNTGHRWAGSSVQPIDWQYQQEHVNWLSSLTKVPLSFMHVLNTMKIQQLRDVKSLENGWLMRITDPYYLISDQTGDRYMMNQIDDNLHRFIVRAGLRNFLDVVKDPALVINYVMGDANALVTGTGYGINQNKTITLSNRVNLDSGAGLAENWPRLEDYYRYSDTQGYVQLPVETEQIQTNSKTADLERYNRGPNIVNGVREEFYFNNNRARNVWRLLWKLEKETAGGSEPLFQRTADAWLQDTNPSLAGNQNGILWELEEWARRVWPGTAASPNDWHPTTRP
jgi:hypothetical protein